MINSPAFLPCVTVSIHSIMECEERTLVYYRLCRSRFIRHISGFLLLAVILLVLNHLHTTDPKILIGSSSSSPLPQSGTSSTLHAGRALEENRDTVATLHRLLQFEDALHVAGSVSDGHDTDVNGRALQVNAQQYEYKEELEMDGTDERDNDLDHGNMDGVEMDGTDERDNDLDHGNMDGVEMDGTDERDNDLDHGNMDGVEMDGTDERDNDLDHGNMDGVQTSIDMKSNDTNGYKTATEAHSRENSDEKKSSLEFGALMHPSEVDGEQNAHFQIPGMSDYRHKHSTGYTHRPIQQHCDVSGVKSWSRGVVTELHPRINANCDLLKSNNRPEIERVKREIRSWQSFESEGEWRESLSDCDKVVKEFSNNFYNSHEEVDFPLAYILVVYTNPQQMVRLIKALWRPQNLFCIHPDAKQSEDFIGIFRQLSKCLDNVFLPTKLEKVYYQHHTIMDSQLNCYEDLLAYPTSRWKYVINLCGRELPLKTNREMVRSLKVLKGASAVESKHVQTKGFLTRDRFTWKAAEDYESGKLHYTQSRLPPPPIPLYKSFNFIAASQPFVHFLINDQKAIRFRNYLKDVKIPEEEFYASLVHLPGVPGGLPSHKTPLPTIDKYIWMNKNQQTRSRLESCEGQMVHFICIVGVGDLDQIYRWGVYRKPPVFFFNKYFMEDDHVVMDCMEQRLLEQNKREYENDCLHKL